MIRIYLQASLKQVENMYLGNTILLQFYNGMAQIL